MIRNPSQRAAFLRFSAALFGVAIAIALYPLWLRPAPPGQLPGAATLLNLDARAPLRFVASLLLLPIAVPFALRAALGRLARADTERWAQNGALLAMVGALWAAINGLPLPWVILPTAAVVLACTLFRRFPARFSRRDMILAPAITSVWIALLDQRVPYDQALITSALLLVAVRLLVAIPGRSGLPPSYCFALSPLGLVLQSQLLGTDARHAFWPPVLTAAATPLLLRLARLAVPDRPRIRRAIRIALTLVIYPAAAIGHLSAYNVLGVEGAPRISVFEEAEHMASAAEMLRGEKPYRDIIPLHGFIQDALLDHLLLRAGADSIGAVMRVRAAIDTFGGAAQYALAAAASGSPEVGLAAALLSNLIATPGGPIRLLPSLTAVAFLAWGLRRRRPRGFALAAAFAVVSALTSLDYGTYALGTLLVALARARRWVYARAALLGAACVALPAAIAFAAYGILRDALRVTLIEIPSIAPAYVGAPFNAPAAFRTWHTFPEVLLALSDRAAFLHIVWIAIIAGLGAAFLRRPSRRWEPVVAIGVWCAWNALGYAGRQHLNFLFATAPLLAVVIWRGFRSPAPWPRLAAPLAVLLLLTIGQPLSHFTVLAIERGKRSVIAPGWTAVPDPPRARGALFDTKDAELVTTVTRYFAAHLAAGDTYFDFMNRGLLYYLLDRDCPIRQIEVAFYETEERQRDVIARIEANPRIRYALVPVAGDDCNGVDCIPNRVRAPLVWRYLEERFAPEAVTPSVEFWRRK